MSIAKDKLYIWKAASYVQKVVILRSSVSWRRNSTCKMFMTLSSYGQLYFRVWTIWMALLKLLTGPNRPSSIWPQHHVSTVKQYPEKTGSTEKVARSLRISWEIAIRDGVFWCIFKLNSGWGDTRCVVWSGASTWLTWCSKLQGGMG